MPLPPPAFLPAPPSLAAAEQLRQFEEWAATDGTPKLSTMPQEITLDWCAVKSIVKFPDLYEVARTVLVVPASSGVLERDFSFAGMLRKKRSSMRPEMVEMLLFLHGNRDKIPAY
ncbi:unnamed protein product, partial [Phaeothamnion confervicola]